MARFGSIPRLEYCFAALSRQCWASAPSPCFGLLAQPGTPVSKDALINAAWSGLAVEESNLTVQIAALRRVLAAEAGGESWIETLPRRGYRYVGPAVATNDPDAEAIQQTSPGLPLPEGPSVAVLPFSNLSGDPEQGYLADGMVDDIITGLSRIKWLFVIARNSSFTYRGRTIDVKQVGRELGVRYLYSKVACARYLIACASTRS